MIKIHVDFPANQYFPKAHPKKQIVLHHTVSSTANSAIDWWKQTAVKEGTAFIVDKNGDVYQLYEPEHWAYHIGGNTPQKYNESSIGIEIVNEGLLTQRVVGKDVRYFWFDGKYKYNGVVIDNGVIWRGSRFFANYTDEQYKAVAELIDELAASFLIPKDILTDYSYKRHYLDFNGIVSHHNLRADKSDVSPAWFFSKMLGYMK